MNDIESRLDRLEARDGACEILLHFLLIRSINEAPDGHALLDELRKGVDSILASPEWQSGRSDHAQAVVRQITESLGRAAKALKLKELARVHMAAREDQKESETRQ